MVTSFNKIVYICPKCKDSMVVGKDTKQVKCVECGFEGEAIVYDFSTKKTYSIQKYFAKHIGEHGQYAWDKPRNPQYI